MADQTKKPDIKHFRMQIVDETGQILKGERFYEINKKDIRTVTLLPNEKLFVEMDFNEKKIRWIDYILESRGLGKKKSAEHATIVNGVLILGSEDIIKGIEETGGNDSEKFKEVLKGHLAFYGDAA